MELRQIRFKQTDEADIATLAAINPTLVFVFGSVGLLGATGFHQWLRSSFPTADVVGCSTAGEISAKGVSDNTVVLTAVRFDKVRHRIAATPLETMTDSRSAGQEIGRTLASPDLQGVLMFSKGVNVNGSALILGVTDIIGTEKPLSGGLAGDGGAFRNTLIVSPDGICPDRVVGIGLYGEHLRLSHGSFGGWTPFGPARKVTRAEGNILFELDNRPALELYKSYLGDYAKDLPASGLLFPLEMLDAQHSPIGMIRTILGIDEAAGSLILAGDINPDGYLRLMHAGKEQLIDGAEAAAKRLQQGLSDHSIPGMALLISCVGRKLVMGDIVEEEVEAVLGQFERGRVTPTGFYSYGEIAPFESGTGCRLHNQTMTITFIGEA